MDITLSSQVITGKCREDFDRFLLTFLRGNTIFGLGTLKWIKEFYSIPPAFQQGVYMAFFREKKYDILILIQTLLNGEHDYYHQIYNWNEQRRYEADKFYPDYNTAFAEAVKTANKIYNEREGK